MKTSLLVNAQPRGRRTELVGRFGDGVKIRLQAPPVDGAANEELIRFLAAQLRIPRTSVRIVAGNASRRKRVEIEGLTADQVDQRLHAPPPSRHAGL